MCDDENVIIVDKYEVDLEKQEITHKGRKETNDLKKWFDEEIGYKILDKHHM